MSNVTTHAILISIWGVGLVASLAMMVVFPAYFEAPPGESSLPVIILETYSPHLGIMLAYVYSRKRTEQQKVLRRKYDSKFVIAVGISVAWVSLFLALLLQYGFQQLAYWPLVYWFKDFGSRIAFVVTGFMTYYFVSEE